MRAFRAQLQEDNLTKYEIRDFTKKKKKEEENNIKHTITMIIMFITFNSVIDQCL